EDLAGRRVVDVVRDDTVVPGIEAGRDRVVVREGLRREARDHVARVDAARHQPIQVRRRHLRRVVPAESVEGDEEDRRLEIGKRVALTNDLSGEHRDREDGGGAERTTHGARLYGRMRAVRPWLLAAAFASILAVP